jgi:hypothetical protein
MLGVALLPHWLRSMGVRRRAAPMSVLTQLHMPAQNSVVGHRMEGGTVLEARLLSGQRPCDDTHAQDVCCSLGPGSSGPLVVHDGSARGPHNGALGAGQAYAMTEASHQMTSNPLPHRGPHKPGTVGRAQGSVEVRRIPQRSIRDI